MALWALMLEYDGSPFVGCPRYVLRRQLERAHDLGYSFFDDNGKGKATWRFFLTAGYFEPRLNGVEFYRQMVKDGKKVVVLAGTYKARAILTGLKAKLFNVLITDQDAARNVLDMS